MDKARANRIKQLMKIAGLSRDSLAAESGYSAGTISNIRKGAEIKTDQLIALCSILNTTPNYILGFSDHTPEVEALSQILNQHCDAETLQLITKLVEKIKTS